jgi:hypothetical protein
MNVNDKAMYYPGNECDQGVMPEVNRVGCAALCVHQNQDGTVTLVVQDHGGNRRVCENVPVIYPPDYDPPLPPDEVDPPRRTPYCRPAKP